MQSKILTERKMWPMRVTYVSTSQSDWYTTKLSRSEQKAGHSGSHSATEQQHAEGFYWEWAKDDDPVTHVWWGANHACVKEVYVQELMSGFQDSKFSSLNVVESWICILLYYCHLLVNNSIWRFLPWSALSCAKPFMNRSRSHRKKQSTYAEVKYMLI